MCTALFQTAGIRADVCTEDWFNNVRALWERTTVQGPSAVGHGGAESGEDTPQTITPQTNNTNKRGSVLIQMQMLLCMAILNVQRMHEEYMHSFSFEYIFILLKQGKGYYLKVYFLNRKSQEKGIKLKLVTCSLQFWTTIIQL